MLKNILENIKYKKKLIVAVVFFTNVIDNLLICSIVPIIPEILLQQDNLERKSNWNQSCENCSYHGIQSNYSRVLSNLSKFVPRVSPIIPNASDEGRKIGWILASRSLVQLLTNPVAGHFTNSFGSGIVLVIGTSIFAVTSVVYSVSSGMVGLLLARAIQGLGSAAVTVGGLSLIADTYDDDNERSSAMGTGLAGIAFGVIVGYPLGGFLYDYVGHSVPFLIILLLVVIDIFLIFIIVKPFVIIKRSYTGTPIITLLMDPYILIAASIVMVNTMTISMTETLTPVWIMDKMGAERWQLAIVFIPDATGYFIGTNFFGSIAQRIGRWIVALLCMLLIGVSVFSIPFSTQVAHLIAPHFGFGIGLGIADAAIMPLLALLADTRHVAVYGTVYAVVQLAISLSYGLGPVISGQIVKEIGFSWFMRGFSGIIILLSPMCLFLRNPPVQQENKPILEDNDAIQMYD